MPLGFLNPQLPKEVQQYAAEQYRIPVGLSKDKVHERIAQVRIEKLLQMEQLLVSNGLVDPNMPRPPFADPIADAQATQPSDVPTPAPAGAPAQGTAEEPVEPGQEPAPQEQAAPAPAPMPPPDPFSLLAQNLAQQVPVKILADNHQVFIDFYRDWLTTNDGQQASELVQHVVEVLIARHFFAEGQVQAYIQSLMPMPEMQGIPMNSGSGSPPPPSQGPEGSAPAAPPKPAYPEGQGPAAPQVPTPMAQTPTPRDASV
jgi:hypothetical protein